MKTKCLTAGVLFPRISLLLYFVMLGENPITAQSNDIVTYKYDDYSRIPLPNNKVICAEYSTNRGNSDLDAKLVFRLDYPNGDSEFEQNTRDRISSDIYHFLGTYPDTKGSLLYMPGESVYPMLDYYGVNYLNHLNQTVPVYATDTLGFRNEIEIIRLCESEEYVTYKKFFSHDDPFNSAMVHAAFKEEYHTYSKQSNEALFFEDVFNEKYRNRVKELLVQRLALAFSERRNRQLQQSDVLQSVAKFQSTEDIVKAIMSGKEIRIPQMRLEDFPISSIALLPNGVLFYYSKCTISYGNEGDYTIILSYEDVLDYLQPEIANSIIMLTESLSGNSEFADPKSEMAISLIAKGDYESAETYLKNSIEHGGENSSVNREKRLLALIQSGRSENLLALSTYNSLLSDKDEKELLTTYWTETYVWAICKCLNGDIDGGKQLFNLLMTKSPIRPFLFEDYMSLVLAASINTSDDTEEKLSLAELEYRINTAILGNTIINRMNYLSRIFQILTSADMDDSYTDMALAISEEMLDILNNNIREIYPNELYGLSQLQVYSHDIWDIQQKRAKIYVIKKDYRSAAKCLDQGFNQLMGKTDLEDLYYLDILSDLYLKAEQNEKANATVKKCYTQLIDYTKRASTLLSLKERNNLYDFASNWLLEGFPHVITSSEKPINTGILFSAAMVGKHLRIQVERDLSDIIYASNNPEIVQKYNNLRIKQKDIDDAIYNNQSAWIIDSLKTCYYKIEKELLCESQAFGNYMQTFSITYSDVWSSLSKDDAAIEFINFAKDNKDCYYALVLSKKIKQPKLIPLFQQDLTQEKKQISVFESYDKVWAPILKEITGIKRFFFSPSGVLCISPIENCLELPSEDSFIRLSSCRDILQYKERRQTLKKAALFGGLNYNYDIHRTALSEISTMPLSDNNVDYIGRGGRSYLPGTLVEVQDIGDKLQKHGYDVSLYVGDNGTESSFKSLSGYVLQVLHIATHGFYFHPKDMGRKDTSRYLRKVDGTINFDDLDLTRSGLLMSGANKVLNGLASNNPYDDGVLSSVEISRLDFSGFDLVVLSACDSGLGDINKDGVFGLQRGFKKAGAKSMLMSLWEVDDNATSILMQAFYDSIVSGIPYREALKVAQTFLREYNKGQYSNYKYWAAFVLLE